MQRSKKAADGQRELQRSSDVRAMQNKSAQGASIFRGEEQTLSPADRGGGESALAGEDGE
jgi:hypothetical protein